MLLFVVVQSVDILKHAYIPIPNAMTTRLLLFLTEKFEIINLFSQNLLISYGISRSDIKAHLSNIN